MEPTSNITSEVSWKQVSFVCTALPFRKYWAESGLVIREIKRSKG
jgi:hypothetical protein